MFRTAIQFLCGVSFCQQPFFTTSCTLPIAKPLEMDDFSLPQEADDVVHVRVIGQAQNVVVGDAGFLLWCDLVRTTFFLFGK